MRASEIAEGQGLAGEIDGRPVAVYNDDGKLTVLENVCTHLGCQNRWNAFDVTWDCPCHGSRYHADGAVLRGPATEPLPPLQFHLEDGEIKLD